MRQFVRAYDAATLLIFMPLVGFSIAAGQHRGAAQSAQGLREMIGAQNVAPCLDAADLLLMAALVPFAVRSLVASSFNIGVGIGDGLRGFFVKKPVEELREVVAGVPPRTTTSVAQPLLDTDTPRPL